MEAAETACFEQNIVELWGDQVELFLLDSIRGRVYKWKFCLFIYLFVRLSSLLILFLFQTLSSFTDL